jgi:hypothetical protein
MNFKVIFFMMVSIILISCYAPFSPEKARNQIEKQIGAKPNETFEVKLNGAPMKLAKFVASEIADKDVNFAGIKRIDLAIYEVPQGKRVDFGGIDHRGWDKVVGLNGEKGSIVIFLRSNAKSFADMVIFAQQKQKVLYGRLKGNFTSELSSELKETFEKDGIGSLKDRLQNFDK